MRVYLDHNATSPLRPAVKAAMLAALEQSGNASSIHAEGRAARKLLDEARGRLAVFLGCLPQMLVFTAGGSEANALALKGAAVERLLVQATSHPSVIENARASGKPVELVPVDGYGHVDVAALRRLLPGPRALLSLILANNETGVIQPLHEVLPLARNHGALLHLDAVQAFGKTPVNFSILGCDLLTVAGHKVGGPQGVGALVIRDGLALAPLISGGGQENHRRAGTENLAAIAGLAALAAEPLVQTYELNDRLEDALTGLPIFSDGVERLSNTTCVALPGAAAETLLMQLDLAGIAVSAGAACSSGKVGKSHVLAAMGVAPELARAAIRISLGWTTSEADITRFITVWQGIAARHPSKAA